LRPSSRKSSSETPTTDRKGISSSLDGSGAFQEYRNRVGATVEQYGGKFVVRGGRVNPKEGDWQPRHLLMLEFPSLEQAERWYNSPEYKPLIAIREKAARTQLLIAEGT
jgi:uncharacterized protein (DUF1330 family)